jgi:hypothetical protein
MRATRRGRENHGRRGRHLRRKGLCLGTLQHTRLILIAANTCART